MAFWALVKMALAFVPAGIWCGVIFILTFISANTVATANGNGISIGLMEVWSLYSPNIPISIFLGAAFPILYLITVDKKKISNEIIGFILICYIVGIIEYMMFKEPGKRFSHANFGWGYRIGITLLFVFVGSDYLRGLLQGKEKQTRVPYIISSIVLTLNVLYGIEYYEIKEDALLKVVLGIKNL